MMSQQNKIKEASDVYVLMTDKYRISRNMRAQWYLNHLNTTVKIEPKKSLSDFQNEIEIVSIVPMNYQDDLELDVNDSDSYLISANTKITFFAKRYRLVYVLDLSPSVSSVDIQRKEILFDEIFTVLKKSLEGLSLPFYVPASQFLFNPEVFITIIAHIPFHSYEGHQVIAQGWRLTRENLESFLKQIYINLMEIANNMSEIIAKSTEETYEIENDILIGSFFEERESKKMPQNSIISPDISTLNMLRFGLLALQLLPQNSTAGIVVITDGMISLPSADALESVLTQLRHHTISCSFLQIGSNPHPHSCFGFVPYIDFMKFISTATFGAYLSNCPEIKQSGGNSINHFNIYHQAFFAWNFQRGFAGFFQTEMDQLNKSSTWNSNFNSKNNQKYPYVSTKTTPDQQIVRTKQMEYNISSPLSQILSCRLREGYTIKSVNFYKNESQIEIKLIIPWRFYVHIEYIITSAWPPAYNYQDVLEHSQCHYEVYIEGSYNFLHDVACISQKKQIKSPYRAATVRQFWRTLKNLAQSDRLEAHLNDFSLNQSWKNIPESIKNGVPLFYMPPNSFDPVLSSKNTAHLNFAQYWKQICTLDIAIWQKWMHTHRINIILEHDMPLPKNLFLPNRAGRYLNIQSRQALASLSELLKENTDFILLENHSYIKLLYNDQNENLNSFFMIRVTTQLPSVVIHLAFIGGTSGLIRHQIVTDLNEQIKGLKFPNRNFTKTNESGETEMKPNLQKEYVNLNCCVLMRKPIEKIIVRYDKLPDNFLISNLTDTQTYNSSSDTQSNSSLVNSIQTTSSFNMFDTLRRYMHHERWVWNTQLSLSYTMSLSSLARILTTITKTRLQEGFHFAYNNSGVVNMIMELTMKDENDDYFPFVIQYIIFSPHKNIYFKESQLEEEEIEVIEEEEIEVIEEEGEVQLITECWVEPQHGICVNCSQMNKSLEGLTYKEITHSFFPIDMDTISILLSYEYILMMCQNIDLPISNSYESRIASLSNSHLIRQTSLNSVASDSSQNSPAPEPNIKLVPFCFDLIRLLHKCQQAELLFPTLFQMIHLKSIEQSMQINYANEILFDLFISNLMQLHDKEIPLHSSDIIKLLILINEKKKESKANKIKLINLDTSNEITFELRCFCKTITKSNIIITIVPSSYHDLIRFIGSTSHDGIINLINNHGTSQDFYGGLPFPVFVYRCSSSSLNNQFLKNDKKWKSILINNLFRGDLNSSKFSLRKTKIGDFHQSTEFQSQNVSLKQFCKSIENVFWKSFSYSIYKTLQLTYSIDKLDIKLLIEKFYYESFNEKEMNKFLKFIYQQSIDYFGKIDLINSNHAQFEYEDKLRRIGITLPVPRIKYFSITHLIMKLYGFLIIHRDFYDKLNVNQLSNEFWLNLREGNFKMLDAKVILEKKFNEYKYKNLIKFLFKGKFGSNIKKSINHSSNSNETIKCIDEIGNNINNLENDLHNKRRIDERRNHLWQRLFTKDSSNLPVNFNEFTELLNLITLINLDQYDNLLSPFIGMSIPWYQGLIKTLVNKNDMTHINLFSSDGKNIKFIFTQGECLDCFMLLSIDTNINKTEIKLALNTHPNMNNNSIIQLCSINCHSLVENFVNACAYFMWSTIEIKEIKKL